LADHGVTPLRFADPALVGGDPVDQTVPLATHAVAYD